MRVGLAKAYQCRRSSTARDVVGPFRVRSRLLPARLRITTDVMGLNEYEKEEALQYHLIVDRINACDPKDSGQCQDVAREAARLANTRFMPNRFGSFDGVERCVVYSNMGSNNLWV